MLIENDDCCFGADLDIRIRMVMSIADILGVSMHEALSRSVYLMKSACEAIEAGNRLAILSSDDEIVREIIIKGGDF